MPRPILDDALWRIVEPLLPKAKRRRRAHPGRKPISHRQALTGILFVLRTGIPWTALPLEMGCGSGVSCWRCLVAWQTAGVWAQLHRVLLLDYRRPRKSSGHVPWWTVLRYVPCTGEKNRSQSHRPAQSRHKHDLICDARGIPLAATLTPANANDITQLVPLVLAIPPVAGPRGRPRQRPDRVQGNRAYDSAAHRRILRAMRITPILAARRTVHGSGLGKTRWVIERSIAWLHQFRRLKIRYERLDFVHEAFLTIACSMICWNFLKPFANSF